jgi:hypothetical protein
MFRGVRFVLCRRAARESLETLGALEYLQNLEAIAAHTFLDG